MRRMLLAGMLVLPFALATAATVQAQGPGCGTPGGCAPGAGYGGYAAAPTFAYPGYRIRCLSFPKLHQEGPLVNYGPYSGYYPFEPYGPWTSDLRYTGPLGAAGGSGATGRLRLTELTSGFGGFHGLHHGVRTSPCGTCSSGHSWGSYSLATLSNIGHRINPWQHRGSSTCSSCHSAIQPDSSIQSVGLTVNER